MHKGPKLNNTGSLLYLSTVLNLENVVSYLISQGEDPNYRHPSHFDVPILHACEHGYTDCVRAILTSPKFDPMLNFTRDQKIFMGQGVPVFLEGPLICVYIYILL